MDLDHLDIALRLAGYDFPKRHIDCIGQIIDLVEEKGGDADLKDVANIEAAIKEKYEL